jgi:uncharacterized protein (TIGR03083 family)
MGQRTWITTIEHEGHALSTAARHDFKAEVPACPGWTVDDLLAHQAMIHHRTSRTFREGLTERPANPEPPSGNHLGWYEAGLADLLEAAAAVDPDQPAWSFVGPVTAAWWLRRMGQETFVHRVDAEQATGAVGPIDPALAADGIDELFDVFVRARHAGSAVGSGETIHLHTTDVEGEWLVTLTGDGIGLERGHAKGDVAVRGPAADLHLWLWGRGPIDGLEVFGDAALADRTRELTRI